MSALTLATVAFQANPIYWAGIFTWAVGFVLYFASILKRNAYALGETASRLCWLGFALTALAYAPLSDGVRGPLGWPQGALIHSRAARGAIWLLWTVGALAIVAGWARIVSDRVGWLGLCTAMIAVLASWFTEAQTQGLIIASGIATVTALALWLHRRRELRTVVYAGDYEAELVRLCGSKRKARRLIRDELMRAPGTSRAGAALAIVTRLRHARDPYPHPL